MLALSDGIRAKRFPYVNIAFIAANFLVWIYYELPHGRSGRRVAVIGHSRGGHYARDARPAAPSSSRTRSRWRRCSTAASRPWPRWRRRGAHSHAPGALAGRSVRPTGVSARSRTSSRGVSRRPGPDDKHVFQGRRVVRWQAQLVPFADRVEVSGSHVGLVFNRKELPGDRPGAGSPRAAGRRATTHDDHQTAAVPRPRERAGHRLLLPARAALRAHSSPCCSASGRSSRTRCCPSSTTTGSGPRCPGR